MNKELNVEKEISIMASEATPTTLILPETELEVSGPFLPISADFLHLLKKEERRRELLQKYPGDSLEHLDQLDSDKEKMEHEKKQKAEDDLLFLQKLKRESDDLKRKLKSVEDELATFKKADEKRKKILEKYPGDPISSLVVLEEQRELLIRENKVLARDLKDANSSTEELSKTLRKQKELSSELGRRYCNLREKTTIVAINHLDYDEDYYIRKRMFKCLNY